MPETQTAPEVKDEKQYVTGHIRQLRNGEISFIGPLNTEESVFQISFTKLNPKDPFGLEPPTKITFTVSRELLDALISSYFEEYTRKECEAVLIQKLSDKRNFGISIVPPHKMPGWIPLAPPKILPTKK